MNWWTSCDSGNCGAGRGEGVQALRFSMVTREGMAVSITLARTAGVLRDVSFEVPTGAAFGVLGANGAGKSTLLKIIARATTSSEGSVISNGRVAALLELGMGFHSEFTGRQNVMMAGQLLGLSLAEIEGALMTSSGLPISVTSWISRCERTQAACRCDSPSAWRRQ